VDQIARIEDVDIVPGDGDDITAVKNPVWIGVHHQQGGVIRVAREAQIVGSSETAPDTDLAVFVHAVRIVRTFAQKRQRSVTNTAGGQENEGQRAHGAWG
jgi:hypothetical protein